MCLPKNVAMPSEVRLVHLDFEKNAEKKVEKDQKKLKRKLSKRLSEVQLRPRPFCLLLFAGRENPRLPYCISAPPRLLPR